MSERVIGAAGAMIVIISGPSGVGKDTIIRALKEQYPDPRRHFVVTYKSRRPRPDETDGVDYHFVSPDDFERLRVAGELLEASEVHGDWSGTPRDQVVAAVTDDRDAILKIDVQGAEQIKALVPEAVRIFVAPPSAADRARRLADRATETPEEQARRNLDAEVEMAHMAEFDYVVVNETDRAHETARAIDEILAGEHARHPDRRVTV